MATGFKSGGRNFQKGVVTNPKGRPRIPEDLKDAGRLTKPELERLMNKMLSMQPGELTKQLKSGELTCKEMLIGTIISKGIIHGDQHRLDFILNRLIGKVKEQVEYDASFEFTIKKKFGPDAGEESILSAAKAVELDEPNEN